MSTSTPRACVRLFFFVILTILLLPPYILCFSLWPRAHYAARSTWARMVCRLIGLRVRVIGVPCSEKAALYVANHVSYLEIPVLSGLLDATLLD